MKYVQPDTNNLAAVFNNYNKTSRPKNELTLPTDHSDIHTRLHLQGTTYATTPTNVQALITFKLYNTIQDGHQSSRKDLRIRFTTGFRSNHTYHQR